jgi:hypothetical protein
MSRPLQAINNLCSGRAGSPPFDRFLPSRDRKGADLCGHLLLAGDQFSQTPRVDLNAGGSEPAFEVLNDHRVHSLCCGISPASEEWTSPRPSACRDLCHEILAADQSSQTPRVELDAGGGKPAFEVPNDHRVHSLCCSISPASEEWTSPRPSACRDFRHQIFAADQSSQTPRVDLNAGVSEPALAAHRDYRGFFTCRSISHASEKWGSPRPAFLAASLHSHTPALAFNSELLTRVDANRIEPVSARSRSLRRTRMSLPILDRTVLRQRLEDFNGLPFVPLGPSHHEAQA